MLTFQSKKERKTLLGLIMRQQKTVPEVAKLMRCDVEDVYVWLTSEGVNVEEERKMRLLTERSKEELIQEIYMLRSKLSARDTRVIVLTSELEQVKRLYEETKRNGMRRKS